MPSDPVYPKTEERAGSISYAGPSFRGTTNDSLTRELSNTHMTTNDTRTNSAVRQARPTYPSGSIESKTESSAVCVNAYYTIGPASFCTREANREGKGDNHGSGNLPKEKARRTVLDRSIKSKVNTPATGVPLGTNYNPRICGTGGPRSAPSETAQEKLPSYSLASSKTIVRLKPLNIGFAKKNSEFISLDKGVLGRQLDKWCPHFERLSIDGFEDSLNIFKFEGLYYSEEIMKLWQLQTIERYTNNVWISGSVIQTPADMSLYRVGVSLRIAGKLSGEIWKSLNILENLPTKRKRSFSLCDLYYTTKTIQDILNGKSVIKTLVEVFKVGIRDHELCVMEFENKYYTLENERLWILKHAEKVLGKLNIIGNIKISMDHLLFHSFTAKDITNVDINLTHDIHTDEEKFMLEYIQRLDKELL
jgi:hypothetical protein